MFKFELDLDKSQCTLDALIAEEGLKEFGEDLLAKLRMWLRKIHLWIQQFFAKKKIEDIKNTPENVIKEAIRSVKNPFGVDQPEEGYIFQPDIRHMWAQQLTPKIIASGLGKLDDVELGTFIDSYESKFLKIESVPAGCIDSSYSYTSKFIPFLTKLLDDITSKLQYVDLGKYPSSRRGIVLLQKALVVCIKTLKYYDDILENVQSDIALVKYSVNDSEKFSKVIETLGSKPHLSDMLIRVYIYVYHSDANSFSRMLERLVQNSGGKYKLYHPAIGSHFDRNYMKSNQITPDILTRVIHPGVIRIKDEFVVLKATVEGNARPLSYDRHRTE